MSADAKFHRDVEVRDRIARILHSKLSPGQQHPANDHPWYCRELADVICADFSGETVEF